MQIENNKEQVPFGHYEALFRAADAGEMAERTGAKYEDGKFYVNLLGTEYGISHPEYAITVTNRHCEDPEGIEGDVAVSKAQGETDCHGLQSKPRNDSEEADCHGRQSRPRNDSVAGEIATSPAAPRNDSEEADCHGRQSRPRNDSEETDCHGLQSKPRNDSGGGEALVPLPVQTFLLRFLLEGKQVAWQGQWKTFREMPWGELYIQPYTGRVLTRAAFTFGTRVDAFAGACEKMGAAKLSHGDAGYEFDFLGGYKVRLLVWAGDEEFPPNAQILYADNFETGFAPEDRVVAGDILISVIKSNM